MKISNVDVAFLKEKYGTPLYIFDEEHIRKNMDGYLKYLHSDKFDTEVLYASKAFSVKEIYRIAIEKGMNLDCVSYGELYTAKQVGFDFSKIYFHGNNKTLSELEYAVSNGVGVVVVDNLMELEALEAVCKRLNKKQSCIVRVNVGVSAHTHKFIVTAHVDSKFGVMYGSDDFKAMQKIFDNSEYVSFDGFHSHIGSQIFDLEAFRAALVKLIGYAKDYKEPLILNIGGGFGVKYTSEDSPIPFDVVSTTLIKTAEEELAKENLTIRKLAIEPGRSIVAEAGYTLYTIGYQKKTPNKEYYFIDGGMTDNIRPALYQAKYDCEIVGKENLPHDHKVTIAGKCCESGDLIIEDYNLPEAKMGDLLITFTTGAYGYSMSSNYNKALTPAVVFVRNGEDKLVCKRMTYDELIEREL